MVEDDGAASRAVGRVGVGPFSQPALWQRADQSLATTQLFVLPWLTSLALAAASPLVAGFCTVPSTLRDGAAEGRVGDPDRITEPLQFPSEAVAHPLEGLLPGVLPPAGNREAMHVAHP